MRKVSYRKIRWTILDLCSPDIAVPAEFDKLFICNGYQQRQEQGARKRRRRRVPQTFEFVFADVDRCGWVSKVGGKVVDHNGPERKFFWSWTLGSPLCRWFKFYTGTRTILYMEVRTILTNGTSEKSNSCILKTFDKVKVIYDLLATCHCLAF